MSKRKNKNFHKNTKTTVSKKKNNIVGGRNTITGNQKTKNTDGGRIVTIDYLILILYMAVAFVPHFRAFDVVFTQWYYISIVNLVSFAYILLNKNHYKLTFNNKLAKFVFLGSLGFLALACLSILKAISLSESIVFLSMLLLTLIAFFIIYTIVKENPKKYFSFIAYVLLVSLFIEAVQVINHFAIKNGSQPRSSELFKGLNPTYGNRNILAASLIIKMSLAFYIFYKSKLKGRVLLLIVIFMSVLSVLLVGARTAIYGLPIIIVTLLIGFVIIEEKSKIQVVKKVIIPVIAICLFAFLGSLSVNKIHKGKLNSFYDLVFTKGKKSLYVVKKGGQNAPSLASDSGRKYFWSAAIEGFKENPIMGVGVGNWKMIDKPELVRSRKNNSYFYPRRVHNDFLQVLSEMGVLGFLVFISFFGLIYFLLIKNVLKNENKELRLINLAILGAFMAYSLDSLINFPAERTPIQIMMFGILATVISFNQKERISIHKYIGYGLLGLMAVLVYLNHQVFISSKYQLIMRNNINGKNLFKAKYKVGYDQMNRLLTDFPKLNGMGQPNDFGLAALAYSEGKYIQTMDHLNKAIEAGPYQQEHMGFKAMIFELNKTYKNEDSALYYAKKVFKYRPGVINQFNILRAIYTRRKDTANLLKVYNKHLKNLPSNENAWLGKSNFYLRHYKDIKRAQQVLDSALLFRPNSKALKDAKKRLSNAKLEGVIPNNVNLYTSARKYFAEGNFTKARKELLALVVENPSNNVYKLTLGQAEINLKNYPAAIKNITEVINSGQFKDGKPEYNRGIAYLRSGQKKKASADFRASKAKGFHLAKKLDKRLLNY